MSDIKPNGGTPPDAARPIRFQYNPETDIAEISTDTGTKIFSVGVPFPLLEQFYLKARLAQIETQNRRANEAAERASGIIRPGLQIPKDLMRRNPGA